MAEYYTAEEAMGTLRKTKTVFYQLVNNGEIPFEIDPGRKRGKRFPKSAIDILANLNVVEEKGKEPLSLTTQTVAELWQGMEITRKLYSQGGTYEDEVPFETLMRWRSINSDIFMSLKEGDTLIGGVTFIPIDEKIAIELVKGRLKEKDIPTRAIRKWTENNLSVYIPTIEVLPSGNERRDTIRGIYLLRHAVKWGVLMAMQHSIKNWYAIGATEKGTDILETLGFSKIAENGYTLETKKEPVKLLGMFLREFESERVA